MDNFIFNKNRFGSLVDDSLISVEMNDDFNYVSKYNGEYYAEIIENDIPFTVFTQEDVRNFNKEMFFTVGEEMDLLKMSEEQFQKYMHLDIQEKNWFIRTKLGRTYFRLSSLHYCYDIMSFQPAYLALVTLLAKPSDFKYFTTEPYEFIKNKDSTGFENYLKDVFEDKINDVDGIAVLRTSLQFKSKSQYNNNQLLASMLEYLVKTSDPSTFLDDGKRDITKMFKYDTMVLTNDANTKTTLYEQDFIKKKFQRDSFLFQINNENPVYSSYDLIPDENIDKLSFIFESLYMVQHPIFGDIAGYIEVFPQNKTRNFRPMFSTDYIRLNQLAYDAAVDETGYIADYTKIPTSLKWDIVRALEIQEYSLINGSIPIIIQSNSGRYFLHATSLVKLQQLISYLNACFAVSDDYANYNLDSIMNDEQLGTIFAERQKLRIVQLKADLRVKLNLSDEEIRKVKNIDSFLKVNKKIVYVDNVVSTGQSQAFGNVEFSNPPYSIQGFLRPQKSKFGRKHKKQTFSAVYDAIIINDEDVLTTDDTIVNLPTKIVTTNIESIAPPPPPPKPTTPTTVATTTPTVTASTTVNQIQEPPKESGGGGIIGLIFFIIIVAAAIFFGGSRRRRGPPRGYYMQPVAGSY